MKYLTKYKAFEAVIIPIKIENNFIIKSFEDLVNYGNENDFDVVEYDEFYNSLDDIDKSTAPPKNGIPYFALFHPINNKPMFVICNRSIINRIPNFKEVVDDIIGHEKIHGEQINRRGGLVFELPSPMETKKYFSNKEEIMAFSWSIANSLSKKFTTIEDSFNELKNSRSFSEHGRLWNAIQNNCDESVIKRYRKYIYMYLEKIFNDK